MPSSRTSIMAIGGSELPVVAVSAACWARISLERVAAETRSKVAIVAMVVLVDGSGRC